MRRDTGPARLPALPPVATSDPALKRWVDAVAERLEVREGSRGNEYERAVTKRELDAVSSTLSKLSPLTEPKTAAPGQTIISLAPGLSAVVPIDAFSQSLRQTQLYRDLVQRIDDPSRFSWLSSELRGILTRSIADEAALRGADIRRVETRVEDAYRSLAMVTTEITAALNNNSAGIRELQAVYVNESTAQATKVTQLEVSLGNYYQDGTPGRAALESTLGVGANPTSGLRAQYTLKLQAGGAIAGYGIAATEVNGVPSSAFIINADKFAVVSPSYTGGLTTSPSLNDVPFGVDANGIYLNTNVYVRGTLRVDATGKTLADGLRGSVAARATGASWSDTLARQAVWLFIGNSGSAVNNNHLVIGDTVSLTNGSSWRQGYGYSALTAYQAGDVVSDGTILYRAVVASTGQLLTNETYWQRIATAISRGEWATNTTYNPFDVVQNTGPGGVVTFYYALHQHRSDPWIRTRGTYSTVTAYVTGDYVLRASPLQIYQAVANSTNQPLTNTAFWTLIGTYANRGAWTANTVYLQYDVVTANDAAGVSRTWFANATTSSAVTPFQLNPSGGTYSETRYWSGTAWLSAGVVINGNLLVTGSITGDKIAANAITASQINGQNLVIYSGSHTSTFVWPASGNGMHLSGSGLLLGNANTGPGYFRVQSNGDIYAPGFTVVGGNATFSGTLSASIVNTDQIVGNAASTAFSTSGTGASVSLSVTVPSGASAVLISFYLGPTYLDTSGGKYAGTVTGPVLTDLSITGVGNTPAIIISPGAGTFTLNCTRASFEPGSTMRLSALILKR